MREMSATIHDVKTVLNSVESHYSEDNIAKRDAWMKWVMIEQWCMISPLRF